MRAASPVPVKTVLVNTPDIEVWPGGLLRARSNHDARVLSRATRVLRRKRDGRYLAAEVPESAADVAMMSEFLADATRGIAR